MLLLKRMLAVSLRSLLPGLLLGLLLGGRVFAGGLEVEDPWIAEGPPGSRVLAGYMGLHNTWDHTVAISGISTSMARSTMLHKTVEENGMARMVHQGAIVLAPGQRVVLEPGGIHLMLMGPQALKAGQQVPLVIEFANGARQPVTATVRRRD